jgi:hypothetical protein
MNLCGGHQAITQQRGDDVEVECGEFLFHRDEENGLRRQGL